MSGSSKTVHISIGNSDDKLNQLEWHTFCASVDSMVASTAGEILGRWFSLPNDVYQNAAWALEPANDRYRDQLRHHLSVLARRFDQDSIAWNESETEFLQPEVSESEAQRWLKSK